MITGHHGVRDKPRKTRPPYLIAQRWTAMGDFAPEAISRSFGVT
jgi:hypothetical protein